MQRRLPALSATCLVAMNDRQGHGLRMPDCNAREARSTSRKQLMDGNKLEVSDWNLKFGDKSNSGRLTGQCQPRLCTMAVLDSQLMSDFTTFYIDKADMLK